MIETVPKFGVSAVEFSIHVDASELSSVKSTMRVIDAPLYCLLAHSSGRDHAAHSEVQVAAAQPTGQNGTRKRKKEKKRKDERSPASALEFSPFLRNRTRKRVRIHQNRTHGKY